MSTAVVPTLPAYRTRDDVHLMVWCKHCQKWHAHGAVSGRPGDGDGHRVNHCGCNCSPYAYTGYNLQEVIGEWFEDQPEPPTINIEKAVRAMTKAERVAYLQDRGWYRLSAQGSQCWFAPGWRRITRYRVDPPEHDHGFYTLAAAIRKALSDEAGVHRR